MSVYDFQALTRTNQKVPLHYFHGKVMLIVNTASKCRLTDQFKDLELLYDKYQKYGLLVLGFPCNQFAHQDPEDNYAIVEYCQRNYGVTFPMFAKVKVNGDQAHPLFTYLKAKAPGLFFSNRIKWNFTKFLVDHEGKVIRRYAPTTNPRKLKKDIENALLALRRDAKNAA